MPLHLAFMPCLAMHIHTHTRSLSIKKIYQTICTNQTRTKKFSIKLFKNDFLGGNKTKKSKIKIIRKPHTHVHIHILVNESMPYTCNFRWACVHNRVLQFAISIFGCCCFWQFCCCCSLVEPFDCTIKLCMNTKYCWCGRWKVTEARRCCCCRKHLRRRQP